MKLARYLIGLIGGASLGMLFAPKKGEQLRKEIIKKAKEGEHSESFHTLLEAFKGAGQEIAKEAKKLMSSEEVKEFMLYGKEQMDDMIETAQDRGIEFASLAQGKLEELSEMASKKAKELETMARSEAFQVKNKMTKGVQGMSDNLQDNMSEVIDRTRKIRMKVQKKIKKASGVTRRSAHKIKN